MKQLFTLLSILVVSSSLLSAQETIEQPYYWQTWIYSNDSARLDAGLPVALPDMDTTNSLNNTQWRGVGQVVSLPLIYDWFSTVYDANDGIDAYRPVLVRGDMTEDEYIKQFQGAQSFTIDTILTWIYSLDSNAANNTETLGSFFSVFKTDFNFKSTQYLSSGFEQPLSQVRGEGDENVLVEEYLDPGFMAGQVSDRQVSLTVFTFEPGELTFEKNESAILLFWNPLDPAYTFPELADRINNKRLPDQRNFIFAQTEFRTGSDGPPDARRDSLTYYKALGLVLYRDGSGVDRQGDPDTDTLASAWDRLFYQQRRSLLDMKAMVIGTVEIGETGVRYHFGRDAAEQGLGNVTPNPVRDDARLPFALNERAHVTIELFSVSGEKVATIVEDEPYIAGNYSAPLPVSTLENGTYVVRMTAGEKAYSMKFTVAK